VKGRKKRKGLVRGWVCGTEGEVKTTLVSPREKKGWGRVKGYKDASVPGPMDVSQGVGEL